MKYNEACKIRDLLSRKINSHGCVVNLGCGQCNHFTGCNQIECDNATHPWVVVPAEFTFDNIKPYLGKPYLRLN